MFARILVISLGYNTENKETNITLWIFFLLSGGKIATMFRKKHIELICSTCILMNFSGAGNYELDS